MILLRSESSALICGEALTPPFYITGGDHHPQTPTAIINSTPGEGFSSRRHCRIFVKASILSAFHWRGPSEQLLLKTLPMISEIKEEFSWLGKLPSSDVPDYPTIKTV
jgi:hypothetical protein